MTLSQERPVTFMFSLQFLIHGFAFAYNGHENDPPSFSRAGPFFWLGIALSVIPLSRAAPSSSLWSVAISTKAKYP